MSTSLKKHSISRDYFLIFTVILLAIMGLSLVYTWSVYHSREEIRHQALYKESNRIDSELKISFDYVSHLMTYLGAQIVKGDSKNLNRIVELLHSNLITDEATRERFSWVMFDWDTPNMKMVASTMFGVLKQPKDVSNRYYAQMAAKEPWKLNFDSPDTGISSGEWIIPAGMGITDKKGKFVGMLSLGFNVERLSQKIQKVIDGKEVSFLILDDHYKVALHSFDNDSAKLQGNMFRDQLQQLAPSSARSGFLLKPIQSGDIVYSYYDKIDGYPFIILTGYNSAITHQDMIETLLPGILGLTVLGLVVFMLLSILRHLVVKPVVHLSEIADKIMAGESITTIDGCNTHETSNLANKLLKIKDLMEKEKRVGQLEVERQLLENKIIIAKEADIEKEKFLKDMYRALKEPLLMIRNGANVARRAAKKKFSPEEYSYYFNKMWEAANQLLTYTTDVLYPTEVDIKEIVEKCIIIQKKIAADRNLTLTYNIADDIPLLWADKLRLRQVLLSTIHESISFTPPANGTVHVEVAVERTSDGQPAFLILTVKDNGMGWAEDERQEFNTLTRIHRPELDRDPDASTLTFRIIKHLIKLHHGQFSIEANLGLGTVFTIRLPYLNKEQLTISPKNLTQFDDDLEQDISAHENVVKFPVSRNETLVD